MNIRYFLGSTLLFLALAVHSQTESLILESFDEYTELTREVSFAHLNKDLVLVGEDLGFQVYTFTKEDKLPSSETTNLYCTLEDDQGRLVQSAMLLSKGGAAQGTIEIDSSFVSGDYTFRAYTSWMRNFKEHNFYSQQVKIINPETFTDDPRESAPPDYDIQFLPEGGHLLSGVKNIVGVVAKNKRGRAIPDLEGAVYRTDGTKITTFRTDRYGLAKFMIFPTDDGRYGAKFPSLTERLFPLGPVEPKGVTLSLDRMDEQVALSFKTNQSTLPTIANKDFTLAIHNGKYIKATKISFGGNAQVVSLFKMKDFWPGVNVITLFDESGNPLLERLFFKYDGIGTMHLGSLSTKRERDSVTVELDFDKSKSENPGGHLSVSILPKGSLCYGAPHNIISQIYLRPYLKGPLENARYYFEDIDRRKKYDMDLLMLTQGWSSYDWGSIFDAPPEPRYPFEEGVTVRANNLTGKADSYMFYSLENTPGIKVDVTEGSKSFELTDLLPLEGESLSVAKIGRNGSLDEAGLYYQFSPMKVPKLEYRTDWSPKREMDNFDKVSYQMNIEEKVSEGVELLDEVVIKAQRRKIRLQSLPERIYGKVLDPSENDKLVFYDLVQYLLSKNVNIPRELKTVNGAFERADLESRDEPLFFLDGQQVIDLRLLQRFPMTMIDYITINGATNGTRASALGEGGRGANGVVRIYTIPKAKRRVSNNKVYQQVGFPIAFSLKKKFYTPKYVNYDSEFYKSYGVVDWKPGLSLDSESKTVVKFKDHGLDQVVLYIEGVTAEGELISEIKDLKF